jgi:hypothetical protein
VEITSNGELQSEVKHQAYKGARLSGCLNDIIWKNKYLSLGPKVRIYSSVVQPVLTYAAEIRADTSKTEHPGNNRNEYLKENDRERNRPRKKPGY